MGDDWITTTEAVAMTGYHANHIRRLIRQRRIRARKFGTLWQVSRSSLQAYLELAEKSPDRRWGPK